MTLGDLIDRERREAAQEAAQEAAREATQIATKETTIDNILELLKDVGSIPSDLSERLEDIQDIDCLKKLLKIAARVDSIDAFEEKMREII